MTVLHRCNFVDDTGNWHNAIVLSHCSTRSRLPARPLRITRPSATWRISCASPTQSLFSLLAAQIFGSEALAARKRGRSPIQLLARLRPQRLATYDQQLRTVAAHLRNRLIADLMPVLSPLTRVAARVAPIIEGAMRMQEIAVE
jgi:hypothetical protein